MKILVTGGSGLLGYDVCRELERCGIQYTAPSSKEMDITDANAVWEQVRSYQPDAVIHCAAWTNADAAEDMPERVFAVNEGGTRNIAIACQEIGAKMLYISTDYVFPGTGTHFNEPDDPTGPVNVYGKSKLAGELAVKELLEKYFIVRISWVFGERGNNFVKKMLRQAETRSEVSVVYDQIGSPTYTADLAPVLCELVQTDHYGIYHITNEGICSWAEFAEEIFRLARKDVKVKRVTSEQYPTKACRPRNSRLSKKGRIGPVFAQLPEWKDALERYLYIESAKITSNDNITDEMVVAMKNIILWGCGKYGQYIFDRLQSDIKGFHVVGVASSGYTKHNLKIERGEVAFANERLNKYVKKVYGYHDVKRMSDTGQIDGVVIAVLDGTQYKQIADRLQAFGIVLFNLDIQNAVSANDISIGSYEDDSGLFHVDILQNIEIQVCPTHLGRSYMITEEQKILWESDRYLWLESPLSQNNQKIDFTIDKALSLLFVYTNYNYAHFVHACISRIIQMEELGFDGKYLLYDSVFARRWMEIICKEWNISKDRIVWVQIGPQSKVFLINQLHCIRNIDDSSKLIARILLKFSNRLLSAGGGGHLSARERRSFLKRSPKLLYAKRSGSRQLLECDEIIKKYGFVAIEPENLSIEEQIEAYHQADVVLLPHGSGTTNCLFMRPGSYVIEAFSANYSGDMFWIEMLQQRGVHFRMLLAAGENQEPKLNDDYTIHPTLLTMTIEEVLDSLK